MTRETRLNLVVLAVVIALLAPGGVILFKRKLEPTVRPMYLPDPVPRTVAYLSPFATPPGKTRVEPPRLAEWVESLARARIKPTTAGAAAAMGTSAAGPLAALTSTPGPRVIRPRDRDGLPVLSDKKTFQLAALEDANRQLRLWVIAWADAPDGTETWTMVTADGSAVGREVVAERIEIPRLIREELGENGVLRPPHHLKWTEVAFAKPHAGGEGAGAATTTRQGPLKPFQLRRGSQDLVNFVPSFTNPGATGN